ncbi:MAG: DNA repair protein RecN [Thermodesulfobacteriota bacterium]|nr:DNA repair protein RecN [Thermodesulfobacteriota bacterium]
MLIDLNIKNLAVIEQLHVCFDRGFTVLSGETGAGKSIIIDAMGLLLGQRMRSDLVRSGEETASVEAVFSLEQQAQIRQLLRDMDFADEEELLIKRSLSRQGKNRVYINGTLATLAQLQRLMAPLLAIFGQHDQQQLQRVENHQQLLDGFGQCCDLLSNYQQQYRHLHQLQQQLQTLQQAEQHRRDRLDMLSYQSQEIAAAQLQPGEDVELAAERLRLQHAERLYSKCQRGYEALYADNGAICEQLGALTQQLDGLQEVDPQLHEPIAAIQDALFSLEDAAGQLRQVVDGVVFDEQRQSEVEQRLIVISELQRKYHPELSGILERQQQLEQELESLRNSATTMVQLEQQIEQYQQQLLVVGSELSTKREAAAQRLQQAMEKELAGLAMPNACFEVQQQHLEKPGSLGLEQIEFYFSANPGQQVKPLASTASGGELSRIMLALRKAAPAADGLATMIFDEVDAGIGGVAASAVGERLCGVAAGRQVLCITHLPQVAAYADVQYRVEKNIVAGETTTTLERLDSEERVQELARMLGGAQLSIQTVAHARDLLRRCQNPVLFD